MNHLHPSVRTLEFIRRRRTKGEPPSPESCILSSGFYPKMQNEPNLTPPTPRLRKTNPICPPATSTTNQKMQNEPNSPLSRHPENTRKRETNPIPTYQVSRHPRFLRNEPNFPQSQISDVRFRISPDLSPHNPKNAKRTQLPVHQVSRLYRACRECSPSFCETNPISRPIPAHQLSIYSRPPLAASPPIPAPFHTPPVHNPTIAPSCLAIMLHTDIISSLASDATEFRCAKSVQLKDE